MAGLRAAVTKCGVDEYRANLDVEYSSAALCKYPQRSHGVSLSEEKGLREKHHRTSESTGFL
jgi:hypothetical protein